MSNGLTNSQLVRARTSIFVMWSRILARVIDASNDSFIHSSLFAQKLQYDTTKSTKSRAGRKGHLTLIFAHELNVIQESPAVADKPARRLRKVCTVYVRAVGL